MNKLLGCKPRVLAICLVVLTCVMGATGTGVKAVAQSDGASAPTAGRTFVYTITNPNGPNAIAAYEAHPETGELIFLDTYSTAGRGTGRILDSQSPLVVNAEERCYSR